MKRKAFTCGTCFKGFDSADEAQEHWTAAHEKPGSVDYAVVSNPGVIDTREQPVAPEGQVTGRDLLCPTSMLRAAIETDRRQWFCSGSDCEAYDHGRDEGFDLALEAFDRERQRQIAARLSLEIVDHTALTTTPAPADEDAVWLRDFVDSDVLDEDDCARLRSIAERIASGRGGAK